MIFKSTLLITASLLISFATTAQPNQLLDRAFWKQSPSVETVTEKIKEGNDPAQFNSNAFDPTVYAILETAPMETVKFLLKQDGNDVNKITHDGRTYIFWAAYANNLPLMKYLVENGAKTNIVDEHGMSVLNFTARSGIKDKEIYAYIFEQGVNAKLEKNNDGANALLLFSQNADNLEIVDYLLKQGLTFNDKDNDGNGVFNYAVKGGNTEFLDYLISEGANSKIVDSKERNAMHFASMGMRGHSNSRAVFEYLGSKGIDPNAVSKNGISPLLEFLKYGEDTDVVEYFLSKGADPDFGDNDGNTALMTAVTHSNFEVVSMLLSKSKNINATTKNGQTALMFAFQRNTPEVTRILIENGAKPDAVDLDGNNMLFYLAQSFNSKMSEGFSEKASILEENGISIKSVQAKGNTFYHLAAQQNEMELLKIANEKSLDVNAKNAQGLTPLHIAAMKSNNVETLKYLLANGADKRIITDFDESAYQLAIENELLSNEKIDLNFLKN